jgi:hypothetical protein
VFSDRCSVCDPGGQEPVLICRQCADPGDVRTYCRRCHERVVMTDDEANEVLTNYFEVDYPLSAGTAIVYTVRCPFCRREDEPHVYPQRFYTLS